MSRNIEILQNIKEDILKRRKQEDLFIQEINNNMGYAEVLSLHREDLPSFIVKNEVSDAELEGIATKLGDVLMNYYWDSLYILCKDLLPEKCTIEFLYKKFQKELRKIEKDYSEDKIFSEKYLPFFRNFTTNSLEEVKDLDDPHNNLQPVVSFLEGNKYDLKIIENYYTILKYLENL